MLDLLKKCALLLLVLSLPLPSLHALAMPLCNQDAQSSEMHQHAHDGDAAQHEHDHDQQTPDGKLTCDGCGMCQACSAPAIVSSTIDFSLDAVEAPPSIPGNSVTLFVPEQPQHPPLAVLA